ncbi:MAG TPA: helix-turn-helix-type transcriptional regulator, partial [Pseudomonas sp.]|nr:helix-turn-helix-type transcriptional regulator [Pseudomonas sp.]
VEVFDWPLPPTELALAVEHIQPRAVLLYSSQALNSAHLQRLLAGYDCPCLLVGQVVQIHAAELVAITAQNAELSLAADPLAALHSLTDLNLLHS